MLTKEQQLTYKYSQNQRVTFQLQDKTYTGKIVGQASTINALPIMGTLWIIEVDTRLPNYEYTCLSLAGF